jgi:pimeloyl-ACP methyl ester carboxylesterase
MRWRPELEWLIEERVRVSKTEGFEPYAYAQVKSVEGLTHNDFIRESLSQIKAPTFIAFGEDDRLIPNPFLHGGRARQWMSWGHQQIAGSQLQGFPRCGHTLQMDCPDDYNAAVLGFLKTVP